jgi:hypothetical protein
VAVFSSSEEPNTKKPQSPGKAKKDYLPIKGTSSIDCLVDRGLVDDGAGNPGSNPGRVARKMLGKKREMSFPFMVKNGFWRQMTILLYYLPTWCSGGPPKQKNRHVLFLQIYRRAQGFRNNYSLAATGQKNQITHSPASRTRQTHRARTSSGPCGSPVIAPRGSRVTPSQTSNLRVAREAQLLARHGL